MRTNSIESVNIFLESIHKWFNIAEKLDWKSYDPFDFLLSPYLGCIHRNSSIAARIFVQIGKHSGEKARRLLKIFPHQEAKTISDYLSAAVLLGKSRENWALNYFNVLFQKLKDAAVSARHGIGWGLGFPYTSRFADASAKTPNIYTTINAINSSLDIYEFNGSIDAKKVAREGCRYILEELGDFQFNGRRWFRYWLGSDVPIINVQASLAGLFNRAGQIYNNEQYLSLADKCIDVVLTTQQSDGSWPYSGDGKANFVDGFHTGFILQGLMAFKKYSKTNTDEITIAVQRGFEYFKRHLLTQDAMPRYFANGKVSMDGQNFAQCIQTCVLCAQREEEIDLAVKIWYKMIDKNRRNLGLDSGSHETKVSPAINLRWTVGPAVLATANLINTLV